jgi:hypothetical protein
MPVEPPPLEGDVFELGLPEGVVAELEEERGEDEVEPLPLDPELWFELESSQATSDSAERNAAAISHLFSIELSPWDVGTMCQLSR